MERINKIRSFFARKPILKKTIGFILLFLLILFCFENFYYIGGRDVFSENFQTIRTLMLIVPIFSLAYGCYLKGNGKLNIKNLTFLLMITGFSLRVGYAFYTGVASRQHDVEMYNGSQLNLNGAGHFSYIYTIFSTGKLPEEIRWQFYHPPLWHATIALFMKIMQIFHPSYGVAKLFEESIVVSAFVGCVTLYAFKDLLFILFNEDKQDISLKNKNNILIAIVFSLLTFHSQFFIMSSWMNNESMAFMFMLLTLIYGIKFHKRRKWSDIILCGLMLGLGATSKVSVAIICIPLGVIFTYDFVEEIKQKHLKSITLKALTFVAICLPISTWFVIRNIILFGNPSIGVPGIDPNTSSLGVIKYSFWQRFGIPNLFKGINESVFCILRPNANGYLDYNVWLYTFKCSVFGEYSYWQGELFAKILLFFNILLALFSLFCMVFINIKDRKNKEFLKINIVMDIIYVINIFSYIVFQILYPVTCTQDFRYMTMILLPGTYFVGKYFISLGSERTKNRLMKFTTLFLCIGFMISSTLYFISIR